MTTSKINELHKTIEVILNECTQHIDNLSPEYKTIKGNLISVLKEINALRIKLITENYESNTRKNNN